MKIGITYDLREEYLQKGFEEEAVAEFDSIETINAIDTSLQELGFETERIGSIFGLSSALNEGKRWELVFNIAEGLFGLSRESQIPALLEAWQIPYTFSNSVVLAIGLHKGLTKKILQYHNVRTAEFQEVSSLEQIDKLQFKYPIFIKPIAEGTGKGIDSTSIIENYVSLKKKTRELLDKYKQPVLIEKYLSGAEFTTGIIGTGNDARVLGTLKIEIKSHIEEKVYSYINKENCEENIYYSLYEEQPLCNEIESLALSAYNALGCYDAGRVDIKLDKQNVPFVIEINPLSGLHPTHSDLPMIATAKGVSYKELIKKIVDSAIDRIKEKEWKNT